MHNFFGKKCIKEGNYKNLLKTNGVYKLHIIINIIILTLVIFISSASAGYLGNQTKQINKTDHIGLYIGGGIGGELPTGPDEDGLLGGFGWTLKLGYQFIKNLALEIGYHQSVGSFSSLGVEGGWSFIQFPFLDLKPIIPMTSDSNLYFIIGIANTGCAQATSNLSPNVTSSSFGVGFDFGMGVEEYVTPNVTLSGEFIYHNFTNDKFHRSDISGTLTSHYEINMSFSSVNFTVLYHF